MPLAIQVKKTGSSEVLETIDQSVADPAPGEVLLEQKAIGVNFIDIYHRKGLYPLELPFIPGMEGAGLVRAIGASVTDFAVGDRVAYGTGPLGGYAHMRIIPADKLVKLPDQIDFALAASVLLKGLTAYYLLHMTYAVKKNDKILVHAAAGGVGLILCQWARHLGAQVIGVVGNTDKQKIALAHGCHHALLRDDPQFVSKVRDITQNRGVDVAYDSVGKATWQNSIMSLCKRGLLVCYGNASGPVPPIDPLLLTRYGSIFLTRPTLADYVDTSEVLRHAAKELFACIIQGFIRLPSPKSWSLAAVAKVHDALESAMTTGPQILLPDGKGV